MLYDNELEELQISLTKGLRLLYDASIHNINRAGFRPTVPEDWDDDYKVPTFLMQAQREISEAFDAFCKGDKHKFVREIADVLKRLNETVHGLGLSLADAAVENTVANSKREYKHGGKRI